MGLHDYNFFFVWGIKKESGPVICNVYGHILQREILLFLPNLFSSITAQNKAFTKVDHYLPLVTKVAAFCYILLIL